MMTVDPTECHCAERTAALHRESFWWSAELQGWLWSGSTFVLDPWKKCPWCNKPLPDLSRPYYTQGEGAE